MAMTPMGTRMRPTRIPEGRLPQLADLTHRIRQRRDLAQSFRHCGEIRASFNSSRSSNAGVSDF
jgi:hypothetical protein